MTALSDTEQATLDRIEAAPAAEESFDAVAAVRRVMDLAAAIEHGEIDVTQSGIVALIRVAVANDAAVLTPEATVQRVRDLADDLSFGSSPQIAWAANKIRGAIDGTR